MRTSMVLATLACLLGSSLAESSEAEPEVVIMEPENPNIEKINVDEKLDGDEVMADGRKRKEHVAQYLYCKELNCYDSLGVKRDSGAIAIKRAYRKAAAEWHPDKNPDPKAKEIFQKYSTAYEVLSSRTMRLNYNYLLDNPYEFPGHYLKFGGGATYAAKSDMTTVLILVVLALSAVQFHLAGNRRSDILKTIKSTRQYQERIKVIMAELAPAGTVSKPKSGGDRGEANSTKGKKPAAKGDALAERKAAAEAKFVTEIEDELPAPPNFTDTFAFTIFTSPITVSSWLFATISWTLKFRILGQEYGTAEKELLSRQAIGLSARDWDGMTAEEREDVIGQELWVSENLVAFERDVQGETGKTRTAKEKRAARAKKHGVTPSVPMD